MAAAVRLDLGACFCGQPATRTLAAVAYCDACAEVVLAPIRRRVAEHHGIGFGEQHGTLRPDWGPRYAELECCLCEAGWVGPIGEPCSWCTDALDNMRQWQAEILLRPELPDADDDRYEAAVQAWAERLGRGVRAELITESQMVAAISREVRRMAA
jgi:hypothetical protein